MGETNSTKTHDDVMRCFRKNASSAHQPVPATTLQCIMVENLAELEPTSRQNMKRFNVGSSTEVCGQWNEDFSQ